MDYDALAQQFGGSGDGAADNIDNLAAEMGGAPKPSSVRMPADPTGLPQSWDVDIGGQKMRSRLTSLPDGRTVYALPLKDGRTGIVQRRKDNGELILKPIEPSASYARGAQLPSGLQGGMAAIQGPTLGFADEIAGAITAGGKLLTGDTNVRDNYLDARDFYRGAVDDAARRNPILTASTQFATSAPLMALTGGAPAAAAVPAGMGKNAATAAGTGAAWGGASAAGNSTADSVGGLAMDTAKGATTSAVLSGASVPIMRGMGSAGSAVMSRVSDGARRNHAKEKTAEALIRDARGAAAQGGDIPAGSTMRPGTSSPLDQARAKLDQLGPDARLVDAADKNSRALLDFVAVTPGRSGPAVERAIRARKGTRGDRLASAADDVLGVSGTYSDDIGNFIAQREMAAAPLYQKAYSEAPPIVIPKDILLRDSVRSAYGKAQQMAAERGVKLPPMNPDAVQPIPPLSLQQADFLKRAMDDVLYGAKMPDSNVGKNAYRLMEDTRAALVQSVDDQAGPAYAQARAAFAGPTKAIEAAELGRGILREDALAIPELTRGLGEAEMQAFRLGVAQAVRDKVGTEGGQNQILKMWANPATRDKLKAVFGGDFRKFQSAVLAEEKKKAIESIGRGSQTAGREQAGADLDLSGVADGAQALAGGASGIMSGALDFARRNLGRVQTPEPVRDDIGRLLLSSGPEARAVLDDLTQYMDAVNRARSQRAATAGAFFGLSPVPGLLVTP